MDLKPKHQGGYSARHADLCERTLVTLLRGIGPWKTGVYLVGGLVPRYLIDRQADSRRRLPQHAGTTDVDLVLDLSMLAEVEAYRRLEDNLKALGFRRGTNDDGRVQHFSWRKSIGDGITVVVDLLCEAGPAGPGRVTPLLAEGRLSALGIPGAYLAIEDYLEHDITAELLDERGTVTETIRIANIVPFVALKALAFADRSEEKDAYDLIYCLMHYQNGPADVGTAFSERLGHSPADPLLQRAVTVLRQHFASDQLAVGARKDGPVGYARFLTDPGRRELDARHRQDAVAVVETFLRALDGRTT